MRCMVTGAAGFIGSHLCERLVADGHTVYGFDDLSTGTLSNISSLTKDPCFHFFGGDLGNYPLDKKVDWIFHLAARADIVPSIENPTAYHRSNVDLTMHVLESAKRNGVSKFIFAASSSCYGIPKSYPTHESEPCDPKYPYALTKYVGEQYVLHWSNLYKFPAVCLRLFNVYGPRHRTSGAYGAVFGVFMSQLANQRPLTVVGDGTQSRDFTFVTDVVDAFIRAAESRATGVYNVGSGGHYSINSLVDLLGASDIVNIPKRPGEPDITFAATEKIKKEIGWQPKVSFQEGVSIMKKLIPLYINAPLWTPEAIKIATKPWFEALT
jgi:UDP-glucose 4-epimerase